MRAIYKYPLEITDTQEVMMPAGACILSVANQGGTLCVWAIVDPRQQTNVAKTINIVGTGNPIDRLLGPFIGTVLIGQFVWHVFGV